MIVLMYKSNLQSLPWTQFSDGSFLPPWFLLAHLGLYTLHPPLGMEAGRLDRVVQRKDFVKYQILKDS